MHRISRTASFTAGLLIGASVLAATSSATASGGDGPGPRSDILRAPIQGSLLSDPPLFGLVRGGAPWVISEGTARLRANGDLRADIEGLIIPTTGVNPVPRLSATVVCNGIANPATDRVNSAPNPFSVPDGNARFHAKLTLPSPCFAPVVFFTSVGGNWFAVSG